MKFLPSPRLSISVLVAFAGSVGSEALADQLFWDAAGPSPFTTGSNWSGGVAPGSADNAIIENGGTALIEAGNAIEVVDLSLENGAITQSGGAVTATGLFTIGLLAQTGTYTATGGTLAGASFRVGMLGGTGVLNLTNTSYTSAAGQTAFFGDGADSNGTLILGQDSSFILDVAGGGGNGLVFGRAGGSATLTMSGNALLTVQGSGDARDLYLGQALGATGGEVLANVSGSAKIESTRRIFVGDGDGAGGAVTATLNLSGTAEARSQDYFVIGRNAGTGFMTISDNAKLLQEGSQHVQIGDHAASKGTLTVKDNGVVSSFEDIRVGASGEGTMNIQGSAEVTAGANFSIGHAAGGRGLVEMTGGTVDVLNGTARFLMGAGTDSLATMNMSGGVMTVQNEIWIGNGTNAVATLNLSGEASVTANQGLYITFARASNAQGTLNIAGNAQIKHEGGSIRLGESVDAKGFINASGNAVISASNNVEIGENGTGEVHLQDNASMTSGGGVFVGSGAGGRGTLTVDGGLVTANGTFIVARGDASTGTVNLNGGTIAAAGITKGPGAGKLNLNGGVLRATAGNFDYLAGFETADIDVQAGGFKMDTNGFEVWVSQDLAGVGGLTKQGTGSLILLGANTFGGFSAVNAGVLEIAVGGSLDVVPHLAIAANAELVLNETISLNEDIVLALVDDSTLRLNFDGVATVAALWINGEAVAPDEYTLAELKNLAGNALFEGDADAILEVTSTVPEPGTLALFVGGAVLVIWRLRRRGRQGWKEA